MVKIVSDAVSRLVELGSVDEENRDIYEYGLHILLTTVSNLVITVVLGFVFGVPLETFLMFIAFTVLRSAAGGYHAKTVVGCVIVSTISIAVSIAAIVFVPESAVFPMTIVFTILTVAIIFAFAPAEHPNRPMTASDYQGFKRNSRIIAIASVLVIAVMYILAPPRYGLSISLGITLSGAAVITAATTAKKGRYEDEE